jgi:hypothetical protein
MMEDELIKQGNKDSIDIIEKERQELAEKIKKIEAEKRKLDEREKILLDEEKLDEEIEEEIEQKILLEKEIDFDEEIERKHPENYDAIEKDIHDSENKLKEIGSIIDIEEKEREELRKKELN